MSHDNNYLKKAKIFNAMELMSKMTLKFDEEGSNVFTIDSKIFLILISVEIQRKFACHYCKKTMDGSFSGTVGYF